LELVYLWVENYKNIHEQGFNFSSRFNCDYNEKTNELAIEENDDYIPNFFGKNINVTAIVGKNGSGKSSVLELIKDLSYENPLISPYPISHFEFKKITIYFNKKENNLYIYKNFTVVIINQAFIQYKEKKDIYDEIFEKVFIKPSPSHSQEEYILLFDFLINNTMYFPFDIPKFMSFGVHDDYYDLLELIKSNNFDFHEYYNIYDEAVSKRIKIFHILLLLSFLKNYEIDFTIEASKIHDETILELENKIPYDIKNKINLFITFIKNNLEDFSETPYYYFKINKIPNNFFEIYREIIKRKNNKELLDFKGKKVLTFDFFPNLSDGEYQLTYLYNMIYSQIKNENILLLIDEGENYLHPNWQKKYISYIVQFIKDNFPNRKIHLILTSHSPFLLSDIPKQNIIFLDKDEDENCQVLKHNEVLEKKQTFGQNIHTLLSDSFFMNDGLIGEFAKRKINEIKKLYQLIQNDKVQEKLKNQKTKELAQKAFNRRKKRLWQIEKIIGEPFLQRVIKNYLDELELLFSDDKTLIIKELAEIEERKKYLEDLQKRKG
jgi:predicted ATPase